MQALSREFEVRLATYEEVYSVLREPKLLDVVGLSSEKELPEYFQTRSNKFHIVKYKGDCIIFVFKEVCLGVFEFHMACPESSKKSSRILAYAALKWIYLGEGNYVKHFYTSCPEGKIANFIRKFGAREVKRTGELVHFMATPKDFQFI